MALILFDYDGVLADTLEDLLQSGQEACDRLGVKHLVTTHDLNDLEEMSFASYGRACQVPEDLVDEFVEICLNFFAARVSPPAIFAGMGDLVRRLSLDHKIAIVTTNTTRNVNAFLDKHDLQDFIHAVYGLDTPGSKVRKINMARERFLENGSRESIFMVGDSLSDVLAAKEASVTSIAVTWGHQALEKLLRGGPDYVVSSPQDLLGIIEGGKGMVDFVR